MTKPNLPTKLFVLLTLVGFYFSNAQQIPRAKMYFGKKLQLDSIPEDQLQTIDSILTLYHQEKNDTIRLTMFDELLGNKLNGKHWVLLNEALYDEAEKFEKKAITKTLQDKVDYYKGNSIWNRAYIHYLNAENDEAREKLAKAEKIFLRIDDNYGLSYTYYNYGIIEAGEGNIDEALINYKKAATYFKKNNDYDGLSTAYTLIAGVMSDQEYYDAAEKNYDLANEYAVRDGSDIRIGNIHANKGGLYVSQERFEKAIASYDSAIVYFKKANEYVGIAYVNSRICDLYGDKLKDDEKALPYCEHSLEESERLGHNILALINSTLLAEIYRKKKDFKQATKFANKGLALLPKTNDIRYSKNFYKVLANIYKDKGDYKNALIANQEYHTLKDSIYNDETRKVSVQTSVELEYKKQKEIDDLKNQQELALAEAEKNRSQLILLFGGIITLLILGFSMYTFKKLQIIKTQKLKLDEAYSRLEISKKNELAVSSLKVLQSQMNPHFIFNALNSVQDLVLLKDIRNSNRYLGKFSDLIRKILLSSKEQFISLTEEIEILSLYLDLEKLRFGDEFLIDFKNEISEEESELIKLPAMFIQPYIENAIKHGLFHKQGTKKLGVYFLKKGANMLECTIEDNGIGQEKAKIMKEKNLHLHTGFSTEAINERIRLLNETLEHKIILSITDLYNGKEPIGTKVTLLFPI